MTDAKFILAAAYKEEIRQIDILLSADPVVPPFDLARGFPTDLTATVQLAQPYLNTANAGWGDILNTRRSVVQGLFDDLEAD